MRYKYKYGLYFKMPIRVYIPVVSPDQTLESKLKFMTKGKEKWRTGKSLQEVQLPGIFVSMKNQNTRHIYEFTIS
jgi:hypothetical protein